MIRIAVIDDGVHLREYSFIRSIKEYSVREGRVFADRVQYPPTTHGSYCAAVIDKYIQREAELVSVNIMQPYCRGNIRDLVKAISWCVFNNIDVINISCGTTDVVDGKLLRSALSRLSLINCVVVAAQSNSLEYTYPASLPQIIGVRCNPHMFNRRYQLLTPSIEGIDIEASAIHRVIIGDKQRTTFPCNSFATAMMCGIISNFFKKGCMCQKSTLIDALKRDKGR